MDADNSTQVESEPLIEADLGENGGEVSFASITDARDWAEREGSRWQKFGTEIEGGRLVRDVLNRQIELPTKIRDALNDAERFPDGDEPETLREIEKLFERYADYASLCSTSPLGQTILDRSQRQHGFLKIGMLASTLRIPTEDVLDFGQGDEQQLAMVLSGYAIGETRKVVKRSDIADVQSRVDKQLTKMTSIVERAETERGRIAEHGKKVTDELDRQRESQESAWKEFYASADEERKSLRRAFEEQLKLDAPATYWQERARTTFSAAMWSLGTFAAVGVGFILLVVGYGPQFLKDLPDPKVIGDFGTLTMVSIPTLTALWILRHIGRLFVTNFERSGDARMRQTMATTFLALTKEGTEAVTQEERLMVLQALFRAPAESKGDEGHFGSALDILSRKDRQD